MIRFELTEKQEAKVQAYINECDRMTAEKQGNDLPYHGAIGGAVTYTFTPTGLGIVEKVKYAEFDALNLTDYDMW